MSGQSDVVAMCVSKIDLKPPVIGCVEEVCCYLWICTGRLSSFEEMCCLPQSMKVLAGADGSG